MISSHIKSFVRRASRMTTAQHRAIEELWPKYGLPYSLSALDFDAVFRRHASRILEIGFGNGENLLAMAKRFPDHDFLGVEVHSPGVGALLLGVEREGLQNVRVLEHDVIEVLATMIPAESLDKITILFPDPWHKKRHHKRRLIQAAFVSLLSSRLKSGGEVRLATDWEHYAHHMLEVLSESPVLMNLSGVGCFAKDVSDRTHTKFAARGQRLGHQEWDLRFSKV